MTHITMQEELKSRLISILDDIEGQETSPEITNLKSELSYIIHTLLDDQEHSVHSDQMRLL